MSKTQIRPASEPAQPTETFLGRPREVLIQVVVALAMFAVGVLLTGCGVARMGS